MYKGYLPVYFKGYGIFGTPPYKPHLASVDFFFKFGFY